MSESVQTMENFKITFAIFIALILSLHVKSDEDDCLYPCTEIYYPICAGNGTDYKFFGSECSMLRHNYCNGYGEHKFIQPSAINLKILFRSICCNQWNKLPRILRSRILFKKISFQLILCVRNNCSSNQFFHLQIFFLTKTDKTFFSYLCFCFIFKNVISKTDNFIFVLSSDVALFVIWTGMRKNNFITQR